MRRENADINTAEPVDAVFKHTDGASKEDSKDSEQTITADEINGSTNRKADEACLVNGNLPGEDANGITASSIALEEESALGEEKVSLDVVESPHTIRAQNAPSVGDESQHLHEDPTHLDPEVTTKQDSEGNVTEASEKAEQEQFPDEDDDDEGGRRDSDIFEEPGADNVQASVRPRRYELSYWPYHLASAERLWKLEEREKSDEWNELWKLVIQFLCDSPDAFKVWQQHYMELDEEYEAYSTVLSPLQVAAAHGIPGLVKILLDRGEPAAAETEDGRSALWFGAGSPDIEIITLLLGKGASPNARKDFPPPFHNLLRCNPKIEFVNLMLEHGADCNIIDQWGFNALHLFALFGSDVQVLKVLLKAHDDINIPDRSGETPLHLAMYNIPGLSLDMLRAFLANGADVNKDDKDSQSLSPQLTLSLQCTDHLQGHCTRFALLEIQKQPRSCLNMELIFMMMM